MRYLTAHKQKLCAIILLLLVISTGSLYAVAIPALTGRVVDNAHILTALQKKQIVNEIVSQEDKTGGQIAVLTIESIGNEPIEEFATTLEEHWKIGYKGKDNGVILILVKDSRKIRIEVGYGWEGYITDARAGDIIRNIAPYFRKGDFGTGIKSAVNQIGDFITSKSQVKEEYITDTNFKNLTFWLPFSLIILWFLFIRERNIKDYKKSPYSKNKASGGYSRNRSFGSSGGSRSSSSSFSGGGGSSGGGGASGGW